MADEPEVILNDLSAQVKIALTDAAIAWLYEAGNEVASHARRNCKMDDTGRKLRGSYNAQIDEQAGVATVGTPMEAGFWEEFGTGSYAVHGDGRKGWWVYVKDGTEHAPNGGITYATREEAEQVAASMQAEDLDAYATNGREPQHTLQNAFVESLPKIRARLRELLEEEANDNSSP